MSAPRPRLDLSVPGALRIHDEALRKLTDAVAAAMAAGATDRAIVERVVFATRARSLASDAERHLIDVIATLLEETPQP